MPPGSEAKYLVARLRGGDVAAISSPPDGAQGPLAWNTYIWVDSADETTAKVREAGGDVMAEPFDVFGAGRMAVFSDLEGAVFSVWQAREHRGARIVNEPGAVNFNGLNTRDVDRAQSFYSAVFGWGTLSLPSGQMWTLPGYGDYLERLTPGIRAMTAQFGAPGFEDVVAAIIPIAGDDSATPAHWTLPSAPMTPTPPPSGPPALAARFWFRHPTARPPAPRLRHEPCSTVRHTWRPPLHRRPQGSRTRTSPGISWPPLCSAPCRARQRDWRPIADRGPARRSE
jgi:predicted enzyme related to lactoylglutathione lyase